jgi:hypothetical protein
LSWEVVAGGFVGKWEGNTEREEAHRKRLIGPRPRDFQETVLSTPS